MGVNRWRERYCFVFCFPALLDDIDWGRGSRRRRCCFRSDLNSAIGIPSSKKRAKHELQFQACVSGGGFAGFFVSLLRLLTKASFSDSNNAVRFSALAFFWISALICFLCVLTCWFILIPHPMITFYKQRRFESIEEEHVPFIGRPTIEPKTNLQVIRKLNPSLLLLILIFTVSFAIYPGITEDVEVRIISFVWSHSFSVMHWGIGIVWCWSHFSLHLMWLANPLHRSYLIAIYVGSST